MLAFSGTGIHDDRRLTELFNTVGGIGTISFATSDDETLAAKGAGSECIVVVDRPRLVEALEADESLIVAADLRRLKGLY